MQRELAAVVGIGQPELSAIENGRRSPAPAVLDAIADALATTTRELSDTSAPDRRTELEADLHRLQSTTAYRRRALPVIHPRRLSADVLEVLVALHHAIADTASES